MKVRRVVGFAAGALLVLGLAAGIVVLQVESHEGRLRERIALERAEATTPSPPARPATRARATEIAARGSTITEELAAERAAWLAAQPIRSGAPAADVVERVLPGRVTLDERGAWSSVLATASDERLPEPPEALVAWLYAHAAELDALAADLRSGDPPAWPDRAHEQDSTLLPVAYLTGVLVASAGVEAWRGEHARAEEHLEAAWILADSLRALPSLDGHGPALLGAVRVVRVAEPRDWLARLHPVDLRAEIADRMLWEADARLARMGGYAKRKTAWLPPPLRDVAFRIVRVPAAVNISRKVKRHLDLRERLLEAPACVDLADAVTPDWRESAFVQRLLPPSYELEPSQVIVHASVRERELLLTRRVMAVRAGPTDASVVESCRSAEMTERRAADGRLLVEWTAPLHELSTEAWWGPCCVTSFTLEAPRTAFPVLASAPLR